MSSTAIKTISPVDGSVVVERKCHTPQEITSILQEATKAFKQNKRTSVSQRIAIANKFLDLLAASKDSLGAELTKMMGRPIKYTPKEIETTVMRGRYMMSIAEQELSDVDAEIGHTPVKGLKRFIRKEPLGVVLTISVLPALLAGNAVIQKPSPQTPLVAERLQDLYEKAGLPSGLLQTIHLGTLPDLEALVARPEIVHVAFTGSVAGGAAVQKAAINSFKIVCLELGGKDPAYVREDADIDYSAVEIADGAAFNSGQSCCAIERVYVHEKVYDSFVSKIVAELKGYKLGDPNGPVVSVAAATRIRNQVADAVAAGGKLEIPEGIFPMDKPDTAFVGPQVLTNVNHTMSVMRDETFGPIIGIQKVSSDEEAIELMNDSEFGLTGSIWTKNTDGKAEELADQVEAGTVFINRSDYPDPALAWTGVKNSGRGCTLSKFGFEQFIRYSSRNYKSLY